MVTGTSSRMTRLSTEAVLCFLMKTAARFIWVDIFGLVNMHFLCHFLSVFMVTLSQNEPSEGRKKSTQLTSKLKRITTWLCFYGKWAQFNTLNK